MKYTSMLFANKIRALRGSKQMLQRHVSAALDVDNAMYCKIERRERRTKKEQISSSHSNVVEHIKHIYEDSELNENATCRNFRQVQMEGNRNVTRDLPFYKLEMQAI
jgi:transcriptional regulator with XRE-family HTH domain